MLKQLLHGRSPRTAFPVDAAQISLYLAGVEQVEYILQTFCGGHQATIGTQGALFKAGFQKISHCVQRVSQSYDRPNQLPTVV